MSGYIKLWRRLREHPLWKIPRRFSQAEAWLDLLMRANWEDTEVWKGSVCIKLKPGDVLTSQVELSERWRWNRKTVRRFLDSLEKAEMGDIRTDSGRDTGHTIVSICNWKTWQGNGVTEGTVKGAVGGTSRGQLGDTQKKIQEEKEENARAREGAALRVPDWMRRAWGGMYGGGES